MSSGFVTETEAAEARLKRQEEWEKVRKPDEPLERPEEPYDGRSLYDRLKEQKVKKDMDYEEAHKLKNLIRGLDDDEVQFLELVDQHKINAEKKQMQEEALELEDFRNRVATLQEESADKKIQTELKTMKTKTSAANSCVSRPTQKTLLGIGIKRKNNGDISLENNEANVKVDVEADENLESTTSNGKIIENNKYNTGGLKCIAVLPGIGTYTESSDSEATSGSDEPDTLGTYDLCGRKRHKKKQCNDE